MGIQYAGGTNVDSTIAADDRATFVDNLKAELVTAGWSVVSGSSGDWKLDSATTPNGHTVRVRLYDPGSTVCANIYIMNTAETAVTSYPAYVYVTAGQEYNVIANKYQCFVLNTGGNVARYFAGFGVLCVPSFLTGLTDCVAWLQGNAQNATDTTARASFRSGLYGTGNVCQIWNASSWSTYNIASVANPVLITQAFPIGYTPAGYRWFDGALHVFDAIMAWGLTTTTEAFRFGLLWDAFVASDNFAANTDITYDSKNFRNISINTNTGLSRGTLFVYAP